MFKQFIYASLAATLLSCGTTREAGGTPNMTAKENTGKKPFWGKMLYEACTTPGNVCLSPISAQQAMAMVANGAEGTTKEEIYAALQLDDNANSRSKQLIEAMNSNQHCEVRMANSIWINNQLSVKEKFINTNKDYYNADVERTQFDESALTRINSWCNEKTEGRIASIINDIDPNARMFLINALYFKGAWKSPFAIHSTQPEKFTTTGGVTADVQMMRQRSNAAYYSDNILSMTAKPYKGGYYMLLALPNKGISCITAANHLATNFDSILAATDIQDVELKMPKFTAEFGTSLRPMLEEAGINSAFGSRAQFGEISDKALCIDDVIQKTYIKVDEQGTEAAAVTAVMVGMMAMPREGEKKVLTLNRPFIYAIIKEDTNEVLFVGKVSNPAM